MTPGEPCGLLDHRHGQYSWGRYPWLVKRLVNAPERLHGDLLLREAIPDDLESLYGMFMLFTVPSREYGEHRRLVEDCRIC